MNQLLLDTEDVSFMLPESIKGGYQAWEEDLSVQLTMIPGNMVTELSGIVWRISYQYGFFWNDGDKNKVISACRKGRRQPITCAFLPPNSTEMITSRFFVTNFSYPKFQWATTVENEDGEDIVKPLWADFSVELREVDPHD